MSYKWVKYTIPFIDFLRSVCMDWIHTVLNKSRISYYPDQNQKGFNVFNSMDAEQADKTLSIALQIF